MSAVDVLGMAHLEPDVDELRCQLMQARDEADMLADELADAVEQDRPADARRAAANYRQARTQVRRLRTVIRVEEGCR